MRNFVKQTHTTKCVHSQGYHMPKQQPKYTMFKDHLDILIQDLKQ